MVCGRPGEDFFDHRHFQKQEYFFCPNLNRLGKRKIWHINTVATTEPSSIRFR